MCCWLMPTTSASQCTPQAVSHFPSSHQSSSLAAAVANIHLEEVSWQAWVVDSEAQVDVLSCDAIHLSFLVYAPSRVSLP